MVKRMSVLFFFFLEESSLSIIKLDNLNQLINFKFFFLIFLFNFFLRDKLVFQACQLYVRRR